MINKAGDVKRIYPCIFVGTAEKNIKGIKTHTISDQDFILRGSLYIRQINQINGK
jgi:hypothetical protein